LNKYLSIAEEILKKHKEPLLVGDILFKALHEEKIINSSGKTQENTLRARLSEDIKYNINSIFKRTRKNTFALKEWNYDEFKAKPFSKNISKENVVCVKQKYINDKNSIFGFSTNIKPFLDVLSNEKSVCVINRDQANRNDSLKQLVSYVILKDSKNRYLSFKRGGYSVKDRLIKGVLCIGFGGHVQDIDLNIFSVKDSGLSNSAVREVKEELKNNNLQLDIDKPFGIINDDSSPLGLKHLAFVYVCTLPLDFKLKKGFTELSINQIKFLTEKDLGNRFYELEFWSQLVIKNISKNKKIGRKVIIKQKNRKIEFPLVIVGEIGSGKSEVTDYISRKFKVKKIHTRKIISEIINADDFKNKNRTSFQDKAYELISRETGYKNIAGKIIDNIKGIKSKKVVIDGIRNIETYSILKNRYPNMTLIYVDVPIDTAYKHFTERSKSNVSVHEFRNARYHPVEKDVTLFKSRADVYIFNGSNLSALNTKIGDWLDGKF